ncbi:Conserved_hypothetical protein [Hexamita inflata]|uniref:Uncharacterized protein n=1 Tax=Hexamita inflata TaxID=28002 RepID=A0ABP1KFH2_9EUKA
MQIQSPDDLIQPFLTEQLKFYLEDPVSKAKPSTSLQSLDLTPILFSLPLKDTLILQLNDFTMKFELDIRCIQSPNAFNRFITTNNGTPFMFQILTLQGIPQNEDIAYRKRYLKPIKAEVSLFGQVLTSTDIQQESLGNGQTSLKVPVRLNCNSFIKETDYQNLKKKFDEEIVQIKVFCRTQIDGNDELKFVKLHAQCQISLKLLLSERVIDEEIKLQPEYQLMGQTHVPNMKQMYSLQQNRTPKFNPAPAAPTDPKELVKYQAEKQKNPNLYGPTETAFAEFQSLSDAAPIGDWNNASIRVRAALGNPLNQLMTPSTQYFERMYIYLKPKQPEQAKQILTYIARMNIAFIKAKAPDRVKAQFEEDLEIDDFVPLLQIYNIDKILTQPKDPKQKQEPVSLGQSFDVPAITGFRFIDKDCQLFFLEAPGQADLFTGLRAIIEQFDCQYKTGPNVQFTQRLYPHSCLMLQNFALHRSLYNLSSKFDQTVGCLEPMLKLFYIDPEMKPSPLKEVQLDLRQIKAAGLFLTSPQLELIMKNCGGAIPKQLSLDVLFVQSQKAQPEGESLTQTMTKDNESIKSFKTQSGASPQFKTIIMKHKTFSETVELPELPESLKQTNINLNMSFASNTKLPSLQVKVADNLLDSKQYNKALTERDTKTQDKIAMDITHKAGLRTDKEVKKALKGETIHIYSQQTLNQQRLYQRIFADDNKNKVLMKDIAVD